MVNKIKKQPCELCGSKCKAGIEIFGQKGVLLSIKSILLQHFALEINVSEAGPKIICRKCWSITNAFHQLYCMVKDAVDPDWKSPIKFSTIVPTETDKAPLNIINIEVKLETNDDSKLDDHLFRGSQPINVQSELSIKKENPERKKIHDNRIPDMVSEIKLTTKQLVDMEQDTEIQNSFGIICELCDENFITFTELRKHFRHTHKSTAYVRCCGRQYRYRSSLYDHIKYHKNPVSLQCPFCDKTFMDRNKLNDHLRKHDPTSKKVECPNCPKLFESKLLLQRHIDRIHFNGPKTFICDICSKTFISKCAITIHLLIVHVEKYSKMCDYCGDKFRTAKLLDLHYKKTHLGIELPKVQCSICSAWLSSKKSLRKHINCHYAKEETCPICGKTAPNRNAMGNHIRKVHSGRLFSCNMCEKQFKTQKSLTEHISTHTGFNLYKCKYCPMEYKYESSLYKHRKDMHSCDFKDYRRHTVKKINNV